MAEFLTEQEKSKLCQHDMEEDIPFLGRKIQRRIMYRRENWTSQPSLPVPNSRNPIKIALVGLGGSGKSSLANTLVGGEKFAMGKSANSVTETFQIGGFKAEGQDFLVLDTPGYMLENMESFSAGELIKRSKELLPGFESIGEGVHAVIFVINSSNARERAKEIEVMRKSKMLSVETTSIKYCMVVATHASSNYANDTVTSFINNASESAEFKEFLEKIKNRIILVEQEAQDLQEAGIKFSEKEKEVTCDMIVSMVGKVMQDNNNEILSYETIKKELAECFPPKALVRTPSGVRAMEHLRVNDEVLVVNQQGQTQFEKVIMFSHAARDEVGRFLSISTDDRKVLSLSPGHLVHVGEVGQLKPAKDVKVGDLMLAFDVTEQEVGNLKQVKVTGVSKEWFTPGIYCPHTPGGSIIVDGILASCYTDLMSPTLAHTLMYPVRMLHRVLPEDWFGWLMPYNSEQGMPKIVWKLRNMIPSVGQ